MGGYGSGRTYWASKDTTDECKGLDVRRLHRNGWLRPGRYCSVHWKRGDKPTGDIHVVAGNGYVELVYRYRRNGDPWQDVRERVQLTYTRCNYGGERPWFLCPECGRRVAILYGPGRLFLCRHCYNLAYESQRENAKDRALRRAQDIRRRLGGSASMFDSFPEKPKGMHWDTYMRLHDRAREAEMTELEWVSQRIARLDRRLTKLGHPPSAET